MACTSSRAAPETSPASTQPASPTSRLDGVVHVPLLPRVDHRGSLMEVVNFDHPFWTEPIVYSYALTIAPGRIKGWGMHKVQADRYFTAGGHVRIVLYDGRTDSATFGRFAQFYCGERAPSLLRIPPGVWHADQNIGEREVLIVNFPTRPYDRGEPDKYRVDPHSGEIEFDWALSDS